MKKSGRTRRTRGAKATRRRQRRCTCSPSTVTRRVRRRHVFLFVWQQHAHIGYYASRHAASSCACAGMRLIWHRCAPWRAHTHVTGAAGAGATGGRKKRPRTPRTPRTPRITHVRSAADATSPPAGVPGFVAGSGGKRQRGQGRDDDADGVGVPNEAPAPLLQALEGGAVLTDKDDMHGMRNPMRDLQAPLLSASRDMSGGRQEGSGGGDKGARVARTEGLEEKASSAGQWRRGLQQVLQQVSLSANPQNTSLNADKKHQQQTQNVMFCSVAILVHVQDSSYILSVVKF